MKLQFLTPALHGVLDYLAASALIALPLLLGLTGTGFWLSIAGGAVLILYSLMTDYRFGIIKVFSFDVHLLFDLSAAVAFVVAPFVLRFDTITSNYYFAMAAGVVGVVAASRREVAARPAT